MLSRTFDSPKSYETTESHAAYALCIDACHDSDGPGPDIARSYDETSYAGHAITYNPAVIESSSTAYLEAGAKLPCYECHNPHGSSRGNYKMFNQERSPDATVTTQRAFCTRCHRASDSAEATPTVAGMSMKKLPDTLSQHSSSSEASCTPCHGGDAHAAKPHGWGGAGGNCADCHGTTGSHAIHVSTTDPRGPHIVCDGCHDTNNFPSFSDGQDLADTHVCDTCHSPGGSYNGVNTTTTAAGSTSVGAKDNWASKVYQSETELQPGKERWCAGCHDGNPSTSGAEPALIGGVYAPPVAGNEQAGYIYGTGYGFYKTGHGVPSGKTIPSNGSDPGPNCTCDSCHWFGRTHIDGVDRTYAPGTPTDYRNGYRLDTISGANPMQIPWTGGGVLTPDKVALCLSCHESARYTDSGNTNTNFYTSTGGNLHYLHLSTDQNNRWKSDWRGTNNSRIQCPACHNVHGSKYLAMARDGELVSEYRQRRPGFRIWYKNGSGGNISSWAEGQIGGSPSPEDLTLAMSDGWVWDQSSPDANDICVDCHGGNLGGVSRTLYRSYPATPTLDWTGEMNYTADGANPDSGPGDPGFTFRIKYADANNDAPAYVRLRIDRNDDGDFIDSGETVVMDPDVPGDTSYWNGVLYHTDALILNKAGDNVLSYYFEVSDGSLVATGPAQRTVTVANAVPTLPWTGEAGYTEDGVDPNSGQLNWTNFEFRIKYKDTDGEAPVGGVKLHIDKNDDGDYLDAGEVVTMNDMGDPSYILGKRYSHTTTLDYGVDGLISYYFEATDGINTAITEVKQVTVTAETNTAPVLSWTNESATYAEDGVDPDYQAARKAFYFRVKYTDVDDDAPNLKQVWIDLDDNGNYNGDGEKITMDDSAGSPPNDGDYTNGEIFAKKVYINYAGDGTIKYCFNFTDSESATATGVNLTERTLEVFDALDVGPGGWPTHDYSTISDAVSAASTGDTVLVSDGTYNEGAGVTLNGKDITIESINGPAYTTISGTNYVVNFNSYSGSGSDSTLTGFTVTGGVRGIESNASNVVVADCIVRNNSIGVYHESSSSYPIIVDGCSIRDNTGVGFQNTNSGAVVTLRDTAISSNGDSGILCGGGSNFSVENCDISSNTKTGDGAAFYCNTGTLTLTVSGSTVTTNTATGNGGAFRLNGGNVTIGSTTIRGNSAGNGGGGIHVQAAGSYAFNDCFIDGNTAGTTGGGLNLLAGTVTMNRTYVRGNRQDSSSNGGGGVYQPWNGTYTYTNCNFTGNYAVANGGGVFCGDAPAQFTNCTFSGNRALIRGGGIYTTSANADKVKVWNCLMYGDMADGGSNEEIDSGASSANNYKNVYLLNTDIMQDYAAFYHQAGNITANPLFMTPVDATFSPNYGGNYHLQNGSPCEGQADSSCAPDDDIDGDPRPQGTGDDMGSDEYVSP